MTPPRTCPSSKGSIMPLSRDILRIHLSHLMGIAEACSRGPEAVKEGVRSPVEVPREPRKIGAGRRQGQTGGKH